MRSPAPIPELLSVEEYLAADEASEDARLELVAGHVFALAGATKRHATIAGNVFARFHSAARGTPCRVYQSDVRLRVGRDLRFYPDVMVSCGVLDDDPVEETSPTILVEVLSDGTADRDLGVKLVAYRSIPSLRMYLIVSQDERRVEVHARSTAEAAWERYVAEGSGAIPIPALDVTLPLDEIYARR